MAHLSVCGKGTTNTTDLGPNQLAAECADVVSQGNPYRDGLSLRR